MRVKHKPFKALHTTRLAIRHDVVRAIRVTERNIESVAAWCGGTILETPFAGKATGTYRRIEVRTPQGKRIAKIGDFVVRNDEFKNKKLRNNHIGDYRWYVGKDDVFEAGFDEVK